MSTSDRTGPDRHADVLVVHASKAGGTAGIATVVADELRAQGLRVDVATATDAAADDVTLAGYRAVVLGSALYAGRWRHDAVRFLRRHAVMLRGRRVWLFQSGPCGPDAAHQAEQGAAEPISVRRLREDIDADPPVTFGGVLDPATAHGLARWMARGDLAGDHRDPERIRAWARTIAQSLQPVGHVSP
ncbi:flavodoxin domain-containing protein [Pseudonocardia yuanmonensis]|uniref:Flavodoxin domain-containing protein n=1 Tax=Pseudonocardia yuanmonensis TaxID=1095914 RepID=A0ABP8W0F4_9PSEU